MQFYGDRTGVLRPEGEGLLEHSACDEAQCVRVDSLCDHAKSTHQDYKGASMGGLICAINVLYVLKSIQ